MRPIWYIALIPMLVSLPSPACVDDLVETPDGPRVAISVAPLMLADIADACYGITVTNGPLGTGEVVWSRGAATGTSICADRFGDRRSAITYVGPCDASVGVDNSVTLILESLVDENDEALVDGTGFRNPCAAPGDCVLDVPCAPNADTPVVFNLTVMRPARQGFFDIAVNFDDIFCSAKFDCTYDEAGQAPIRLLHDPDSRKPGRTAVLGVACTAGPGLDTHLYMGHIDILCNRAGNGSTEVVNVYVDPADGPGNVTSGPQSSFPPIPNELLFQAAVYEGFELLEAGGTTLGKRYWNIALGLRDPETNGAGPALGTDGDLVDCAVHVHATAHAGPMVHPEFGPGVTPSGTYPFLHLYDVPLNGTAGLTCTRHPLDASEHFYSDYTQPGFPWGFAHVLYAIEDTDGDLVEVVTEHLPRDPDGTWPEANPRGTLRGQREQIVINDELGMDTGYVDHEDFSYFHLPATSNLGVALFPKLTGQPANIPGGVLGYQLFYEGTGCAPGGCLVASGLNLAGQGASGVSFQIYADAQPGRYILRVYRAAPLTLDAFRYQIRVRKGP